MKKIYSILQSALFVLCLYSLGLQAQQCPVKTVPYYENLSSITTLNQLPSCWQASNLGSTSLTYPTASGYAAFFDNPVGVNYFYSEGVQLYAGITYSAAIFYKTDNTGSVNWTDLSLFIGTSQSPAGLVSIASTNGPANNAAYTLLSHTFVVNVSGVYYTAIRGTSTAGNSHYLYWDDFSITIPCGPGSGNNTPIVTIAGASTLCAGDALATYTASGAGSYTWASSETTSTVIPAPGSAGQMNLNVQGTNTLSGCVGSATLNVTVLASPIVFAAAVPTGICPGQISTLSANGNAASYSWSNGGTNATTTVSPSQNTTYTLTATGSNGCSSMASQMVIVFPQPTLSVSGTPSVCAGEEISLTASGAQSYSWTAPGGLITSTTNLVLNLTANATYTLVGTNSNNCTSSSMVMLTADPCTGLNNLTRSNLIFVYPNPASEKVTIQLQDFNSANISMSDLSGREINCDVNKDSDEKASIDLREFPKGIYFLEIQSTGGSQVLKIIKD